MPQQELRIYRRLLRATRTLHEPLRSQLHMVLHEAAAAHRLAATAPPRLAQKHRQKHSQHSEQQQADWRRQRAAREADVTAQRRVAQRLAAAAPAVLRLVELLSERCERDARWRDRLLDPLQQANSGSGADGDTCSGSSKRDQHTDK